MRDERSVSVYEIQSCSLVSALLHCLMANGGDELAQERAGERMKIFCSAFSDTPQGPMDLNSRYWGGVVVEGLGVCGGGIGCLCVWRDLCVWEGLVCVWEGCYGGIGLCLMKGLMFM